MKILLFLITTNIVVMMLSGFIDLAFAEPNDVIVIEKPKFCNSANLSYYYILGEFQEEYKYPCATYMYKSVTSHVGKFIWSYLYKK